MAVRKLGISGSEITLPSIAIAQPVKVIKRIERAVMSDGSVRFAFFNEYKIWGIDFPKLTKSELDDLVALRALGQILRYQNNDESATWYNVVITDFDYNNEDPASPTVYYYGSMTLEQSV